MNYYNIKKRIDVEKRRPIYKHELNVKNEYYIRTYKNKMKMLFMLILLDGVHSFIR